MTAQEQLASGMLDPSYRTLSTKMACKASLKRNQFEPAASGKGPPLRGKSRGLARSSWNQMSTSDPALTLNKFAEDSTLKWARLNGGRSGPGQGCGSWPAAECCRHRNKPLNIRFRLYAQKARCPFGESSGQSGAESTSSGQRAEVGCAMRARISSSPRSPAV
jgi:hypothetical protein